MKTDFFSYMPDLFKEWKEGHLPLKFRKQYPDLFDEDDLRITIKQPQYHFIEWLAAIHFHKLGYKVLIEQYVYKTHKRKMTVVKNYLGEDGLKFLKHEGTSYKTQPPDLFVYKYDQFFFVEVKSEKDKLSATQEDFFTKIEKKFKTEVILLRGSKKV